MSDASCSCDTRPLIVSQAGPVQWTAMVARFPDCSGCEAPCCRRQFMEDASGWFTLADARAIYRSAGADVRIVGWTDRTDGRQPMLECQAFDTAHLGCTVYD